MATVPPPPPPPPLPTIGGSTLPNFKSTTLRTASTLPRSDGPSTDSHHIRSVRTAQEKTPQRLLADIHPEDLQRAAERLRKTEYHKSIPSSEQTQGVGRSSELPVGGHRQNFSQYESLERDQTRDPLHVAHASPYAYSTISNNYGHSVPLSQQPQSQQQYSSNSYTTTTTNYNSVPPPLPSQPPPSFGSSPNQNYSSNVTYSYVDPQNYIIKESYQSQPTNNNGIQTYKTYTSTTTSYLGNNNNNNVQPNIQLNSQVSAPQQNIQQQQQLSPSSNYINNPKTYIYDFATKTPIAVLDPPASTQQSQQQNNSSYSYSSSYSTTNNSNTFNAPKQPLSYVEELRNLGLTESQRKSNLNQQSFVPERQVPQSFNNVYEERIRTTQRTDQVDDLVKDMEMRLRTGRDICAKCQTPILGDTPGVTALGKPYHVNCFSCDACQKQLAGCSFYNVDGKNLCQVDYMNSLEKCEKCSTPITQKILRALGKPFHPECFVCPSCQKSLDGIPFTVSKDNVAYCLDCYHDQFSPRCAVCLKAIAPSGSETEVARVIAMNKSYHVNCYRCEDCGLQLNSKVEGAACYPLQEHLFCKNCNLNRLKAIS